MRLSIPLTFTGALLLCAALAWPAGPAAAADLKVTLASSSVTVPPQTAAGTTAKASLLLVVDGLDAATAARDDLVSAAVDVAEVSGLPPTVTVGEPKALPASAALRSWLLTLAVDGMPAAAELQRYLRVKVGDKAWVLAYTLKGPPATSWTLQSPPAATRGIDTGDGVPLWVSVSGAQGVAGLQLGPTELIDAGTQNALAGNAWVLCPTPQPCDDAPRHLAGNQSHQLWLWPRAVAGAAAGAASAVPTLAPGKYSGSVTLVSGDKPEGKSLTLSVQVSSLGWKVWGVLAIAAGVAAAWAFTVLLRHRLNRDQLLLPAVVLREAVKVLESQLDGLPRHPSAGQPPTPAWPAVSRRLTALTDALDEDKVLLSKGLPPRWPSPWQAGTTPTSLDNYCSHLDEQSRWVGALQLLVRTGIVPVARTGGALPPPLLPAQALAWNTAAAGLDAQAAGPSAPLPEVLATSIQAIVAEFNRALAVARGPSAAPGGTPLAQQPGPTADQLRVRIALEGTAAWAFVMLATVLVGSYVLVFKNAGFGTGLDLIECLMWGLGLPAASQLTGATTATVATSFQVTR